VNIKGWRQLSSALAALPQLII